MAETDIGKTTTTDFSNTLDTFQITPETLDSPDDTKETTWDNDRFNEYLGYYKNISNYRASTNAIARWTIGKGFQADAETTLLLDTIKGWGKDTFNQIMEGGQKEKRYQGNFYAHIITDSEGNLINLKPLNGGNMRNVADAQGMLIRFDQMNRASNEVERSFKPEEIFYLAHDRIGDEIHGTSDLEALKKTIDAREEALDDTRTIYHHNVPVRILYVDHDDPAKLSVLKEKYKDAINRKDVILLPKGTVEPDLASVAPNATLNHLNQTESLNRNFYQASGGTDILVGATQSITDAASKTQLLTLQATVIEAQLELKEQILAQLNLVVDFVLPVDIQQDAISTSQGNDVEVNPLEVEPIRKDVGIEGGEEVGT